MNYQNIMLPPFTMQSYLKNYYSLFNYLKIMKNILLPHYYLQNYFKIDCFKYNLFKQFQKYINILHLYLHYY